ncbi:MAG TPA: tetratricopeptide repeat protein [Terriglobia bacterium]|nr:tetratricopeptide repeat protein [Terriglobia bacterium]
MTRKNELLIVGAVILVAVVGFAAWRAHSSSANAAMQLQLGKVVSAFNEVGTPPEERYKKVIAEGERTVADYGGTQAATVAKYYMGFAQEGLGDTAKAISLLEEVSAHSDADIKGMAQFGMAEIHARHNESDKAIAIFKDLMEKGGYMKSAVALELARTYENAGQVDQAKGYYEKVITDYGTSPMRGDAESALRRLGFPIPAASAPQNPS